MDEKILEQMRKFSPESIAQELASVQPMPSDVLKNLREHSMSKDQLEKEGYRPVSRMGLMWIKEDKNDARNSEGTS